MNTPSNHSDTIAGTLGGTVITVSSNIHPGDLMKTVVLAVIGALVSFMVSRMLKWLANAWKRK